MNIYPDPSDDDVSSAMGAETLLAYDLIEVLECLRAWWNNGFDLKVLA
jgi:hypothetical protein